jgi:uncharacterized 2Fe-2S/4Fe-4S cluster protein (DUF4445 family)
LFFRTKNVLEILMNQPVCQPSCTDCRVKVLEGFEHLNGTAFEENNLMGTASHITKVRLSCQAKVTGDIRVEVLRIKGMRLKAQVDEPEEKKLERRERARQELKRFSENQERDKRRQRPNTQSGTKKPRRGGGRNRRRGPKKASSSS